MIVEDQTPTVEFLKRSLARDGAPVDVLETHISLIFLAGDRAFKMKKAVKLPYADFSTASLRLATCEREAALNARTAPSLYLGVRRITRAPDGGLALDGDGETADALVEMARFDQDRLFDHLAGKGRLTLANMTDLAHAIAVFHKAAPLLHTGSGSANIGKVMDINEAGFATSRVFPSDELNILFANFRSALAKHAGHLDRREAAGKIRRCHGDLHLRNICLLDDGPKLFDCIEFNEEIATIDILYDVAFLFMDLWHRRLFAFANLVMNRYLDESDEEEGYALLPFFMAIRAAVRAHVTATQAAENGRKAGELVETARSYKHLAQGLLDHAAPRLIAIGGLSGSGKSTAAELLAPYIGDPPGARFLETDRIRKAMFGVSAETRLGPDAYTPEVSAKVYRALTNRSVAMAKRGGTVVAGGVFDRPEDRLRIEETARKSDVPFIGIWLDADPSTLRVRVESRKTGPSDADGDVLEKQLRAARGDICWITIDARPSPPDVARAILARLAEGGSS
jgi:uncharacterized protein